MGVYIGNTKIKKVLVVFNDGVDTDVNTNNIKDGIRILGVDGTYTGDGTQIAGNTLATASDIVTGKSAWADGNEIDGALVINHYYTGSGDPDSSLGNNGDIYLKQ